MVHPNAPVEIYQLHILLLQNNPPIWRRLHARSDTSIAILLDLLQTAFDWSDFHVHRFVICDQAYGVGRKPEALKLSIALDVGGRRFCCDLSRE